MKRLVLLAMCVPLCTVAAERRFDVGSFDAVQFSGVGELHVIQSDAESLNVTGTDEALAAISVEVDRGVLYIDVDPGTRLRTAPHFQLQVRALTDMCVSGGGRVRLDGLDGSELFVDAHGASELELTGLALEELNASSAGTGEFTVSGHVDRQVVKLAGASRYHAAELASNYSEVIVQGAGTALLAVAKVLDVVVSGAGSVEYIGTPRIYESVRGAGRVASYRW
jgi:hypothetical protein